MAQQSGERVKVVLKWIQILDDLEPFFDEKGEFRFTAKITSDANGGTLQETRFPEKGHYDISDHPAWNKIGLEKVLFEGDVDGRLEIVISGEELDLAGNDELQTYRRVFEGSPASWLGRHAPGDEEDDPENMDNWRVCYEIVKA